MDANRPNDLISKLLDIQTAYRELRDLVPEETCHHLLGYINDDLSRLVPDLMNELAPIASRRTGGRREQIEAAATS
ncbi:MAG: hypothetical protein V7707_20865 [Motiliproteus sp.]